MKIGVSSYSFSTLVSSGAMSQLDVIAAAKDLGFDVIEFSTFALPKGQTNLSFAQLVRKEAARVGIGVGNYTIAADFLNYEGGVSAQVEALKAEVDVAAAMGAPGMRHDATWGIPANERYRSFESVVDTLAAGCRAVTAYAQEKGIRTMVENHGYYAQDSSRVEQLINAVDHPNFGWLVDVGNFLCADEPPQQAVGRAARYAFHLHVKDFHVKSGMEPAPGEGWFASRGGNWLRGAIVGHGNVPVLQCLRVMKEAGYQGTLSLEFEGMEDPIKALRIGRDNVVRYVEMLG
ncbi:MAG: sugar phosphate isomerase/epimerase [Eubacteriales bacterium]|nr:sugar phosphate isomerase/epimerase [Eubacteriales bacterium]